MKFALLILVLLVAWPAAAEEWSVGAPPGGAADEHVAWTKNGDGHVLILRGELEPKVERYSLYAELRLGGGDQFDGEDLSHQLEDWTTVHDDWQFGYSKYGRVWGGVDGSRAYWTLNSDYKTDFVLNDVMVGWFKAREVTIAYGSTEGMIKTTRFKLDGLKEALTAALGLEPKN